MGQKTLLEAANAFKTAETMNNNVSSLSLHIECLYMRGIVLRMLGKGIEALSCYDAILQLPLQDSVAAAVHNQRADVLLMIGR